MTRSTEFYVEFIVLTIVSLVAASIWVSFSNTVISSAGFSLQTMFMLGIIFTVSSVYILVTLFGDGSEDKKREKGVKHESTHKLEMFEQGDNKVMDKELGDR